MTKEELMARFKAEKGRALSPSDLSAVSGGAEDIFENMTDHQTHAGVKRGMAAVRASMIAFLGQGCDEER